MKKIDPYVCPKCGTHENIESLESGLEDMCGFEKLHCCACDCEWEENYSLNYCGYNMEDENGQTIIYDERGEEI